MKSSNSRRRKSADRSRRLLEALRWLAIPLQFLRIWFTSRSLRAAVRSLPAVVLLICCSFICLAANRVQPGDLTNSYLASARTAIAADDLDAAERWLERAIELSPRKNEAVLVLANLRLQQGNLAGGRTLMKRLAPDDSAGVPEAHYWIATDFIASVNNRLDLDSIPTIRHHLLQAAKSPAFSGSANAGLGQIAMRTGDIPSAVGYLKEATAAEPTWSLMLAAAQRMAGDEQAALATLEAARRQAIERSNEAPSQIPVRYFWARCSTSLGRVAEAEAVLKSIARIAPEERPNVDLALSGLYVIWYDALAQAESDSPLLDGQVDVEPPQSSTADTDESPALAETAASATQHVPTSSEPPSDSSALDAGEIRRLKLLSEAIRLNPSNREAVTRLPQLASSVPSQRQEIQQQLEALLQKQAATPLVHFALGVLHTLDERHSEARLHFDLAVEQGLDSAAALNNLAWTVAFSEEPNLEQALDLANRALDQQPDNPQMRHTRGHILFKLERYKQSIADLELALETFDPRDNTRDVLRAAYRKLTGQSSPNDG